MKKVFAVFAVLLALVCMLAACGRARSITKSEIVNGELVLTYSDGTTENLGKVVGDDGAKGEKGDKGDTGETGATGAQGEKGEKGEDLTDDNPQGLAFYLLPDGTYGVKAGKALYLEEITIPATYKDKAVTQILPFAFSDLVATNKTLKKISLPNSITSIDEFAFYCCTSLVSVTIPASITSIGNNAFAGSYETPMMLVSVTFAEGSQLTSIGNEAFYNCNLLTSIEIPASVTSIGDNAFRYCGFTSIDIPASVTTIGNYAFAGTDEKPMSLVSVTFAEGSQLTSIGSYAFYYCNSLTSIEIPPSVTRIGNSAFRGCTSLASVTFAENSQLTSIGDNAFYFCDSLMSVTIPNSVTSVGDSAFYGCSSLAMVIFEERSQLEKIQSSAFAQTALTSIIIPSRVNYLYANAFGDCKMMQVTFENTTGWFVAYGEATTGTALDVSDPALNAYKLTGYRNPYPPTDGEEIFVDRENLGNGSKIWKRN